MNATTKETPAILDSERDMERARGKINCVQQSLATLASYAALNAERRYVYNSDDENKRKSHIAAARLALDASRDLASVMQQLNIYDN